MKKNAGFTLVELIVVIAILGILAGIAIPVYSGYIAKANEAADLQQLDAIKTAAIFAAVDKDPSNVVAKIEVTPTTNGNETSWGVKVYTASGSGNNINYQEITGLTVTTYTNGTIAPLTSEKFKNGATWTESGGWTAYVVPAQGNN